MTPCLRGSLGPITLSIFAAALATLTSAAGCGSSETGHAPPLTSGSTSGGGGGPGPSSTGSGAGGTGGDCGNDAKEGSEQCDGPDFGGIDCTTLGFSGGTLKCTSACRYDTSACLGKEDCQDSVDNDGDGKIDCQDPDCAAACASACTDLPTLPDDANTLTTGLTTGHAAGAAPSCASAASGPETAYKFVAKHTGFLDVQLAPIANGGGEVPNLTLSVRRQCADVSSEIACDNENSGLASVLAVQSVPVTANDTLTIVIDGYSGSDAGAYDIFAETHPLACGDGHIDPPEQCDDGNAASGDGCSSTCQVESSETEPNDTRATANPFTGSWSAMISPAGDVDCVSIKATADGQMLAAETDDTGDGACALGTLDTYVVIYDASGTQLASDDDSGDGLCSRAETGTELVANQIYTACVSAGPASPNATFAYHLILTLQ